MINSVTDGLVNYKLIQAFCIQTHTCIIYKFLAHQIEKSNVLTCVRSLLSHTGYLTKAHHLNLNLEEIDVRLSNSASLHLLHFYSILFAGTTLKL